MKNDDIIDFALSESTGQIVDILEAERGKLCQCVCLKCRQPVIARKGPIRRPHFSHLSHGHEVAPCSGAQETGLHRAAIQIVAGWKHITLPALEVVVTRHTSSAEKSKQTGSIPGEHFWIESARQPDLEGRSQEWVPDVVLEGPKGELRVEIKVTHGISVAKKALIDRDQIPTIEFDLSSLHAAGSWTLQSLENTLRTDPQIVRWVFHPGHAALRERLEHQLKTRGAATSSLTAAAPVWRGDKLVFHPWFGLIPADLDARRSFIGQGFQDPQIFELKDQVTISIRRHVSIFDSWLVSLYDSKAGVPRAGHFDALFSEHLRDANYGSVYFGYPNIRIVTGPPSIQPTLNFVAQHSANHDDQGASND